MQCNKCYTMANTDALLQFISVDLFINRIVTHFLTDAMRDSRFCLNQYLINLYVGQHVYVNWAISPVIYPKQVPHSSHNGPSPVYRLQVFTL